MARNRTKSLLDVNRQYRRILELAQQTGRDNNVNLVQGARLKRAQDAANVYRDRITGSSAYKKAYNDAKRVGMNDEEAFGKARNAQVSRNTRMGIVAG